MKKYIQFDLKEDETATLTRFIGFTLDNQDKGYLVYCGEGDYLSAVLAKQPSDLHIPNCSYGTSANNRYESVSDFAKSCYKQPHSFRVDTIYCFESLKELHRWLSE